MCTTYTTRNRAVIFNGYTVQTLLVNEKDFCPCARNKPEGYFPANRSRLYNPDPKYQCHEDLTCHAFDSIPKGASCDGYRGPSPPYPLNPNMIPCFTNGPCYPPNENCLGGNDEDPCKPERCVRRRRKPPSCCPPRSTYRDLINSLEPPCPECPPPCEEEKKEGGDDQCGDNSNPNNGGYSLTLSRDVNGATVTYTCDPCGNVCRQMESCGNQVYSDTTNSVMIEASAQCGPCGDGCVNVKSLNDPSCPSPEYSAPAPCCYERKCPRPCKRPLLKCPLRTHNYCRCMSCSPRFWICSKPCSF